MVLVFSFIFSFAAFAQSSLQSPLQSLLGQKDFDLYYGPVDPAFTKDENLGGVIFESDQRGSRLYYNSTQDQLLELEVYFEDLETANYCPNEELAKHFDYVRYLYRLAALSYLDEHLKAMGDTAKNMRLEGACGQDIEELLKKCEPKSDDMKLFVKSARVLSSNLAPYLPAYDFPYEKFTNDWVGDFKKGSRYGSVKRRLGEVCEESKCAPFGKRELGKSFQKICEQDSKTFVDICSEQDSLFGVSKASEAFHAISSSDALKVINENGNGKGCLARFSRLMSDREVRKEELESVISGVYERLRKEASPSEISGRLFPAGSLRQFVEGGLAEIFVEKKKEEKSVKKDVEEKPIELAPLAPAPIQRILKPKPKKKVVKAKAVEKEKPKPVKSHFLQTSQARKEFDLDSVKVNMVRFKYDYVFNSKMLSYLDGQMDKFASRQGLEEMKEYDSLGSKKGPVPLLFIKYLIDNERHQDLQNIIEVLGERFYVKNNIDVPELAAPYDYIRLRFEETSDPPWQLYIERNP